MGLVPSGGTYGSGTNVTLTAYASTGYRFDHWTGDLSGNANPAQITMNSNKSVTAVFSVSLVDHYYTSILGRTPDPGGKAYWESEVDRIESLGIDIKEAYMVMSGNFFNSTEYLGFAKTE